MIWANSIAELEYYNHVDGSPCYCEQLVYPGDLILQGALPLSAMPIGLVLRAYVYSADGLTEYEQCSNNCDYYFFTYNGTVYFNLRLNSYSQAMCLYKCWIIKVVVTINGNPTIFSKFTQRYCQTTCCDVVRGVTFGTTDVLSTPHGQALSATATPLQPATECGAPLIRIQVTFPCLDSQLGEYFGIPAGQTWGFTKITNIAGKVKQQPREIVRAVSYNCNLQRAESFIPYRVYTPFAEGIFPTWKLTELESMFHAPVINVTDFINTYIFQYDGGTIAKAIGAVVCWELFQLDVVVRTCYIRQTYGCNEDCIDVSQTLIFLISQAYGGGNFYDENRNLIGSEYQDVLDWYRTRNYVTAVEDVSAQYNNVYAAFQVVGTGYIPTQIYYDQPIARNRVYGVNAPQQPVITCSMPVIGGIAVIPFTCATPSIGGIVIIPQTVEQYNIFNFYPWTVGSGTVTRGAHTYNLSIDTRNTLRTFTSPLTAMINEPIGAIDPDGAPATPVSIALADGSILNIDTHGNLLYTGYPTAYGDGYIAVILNDIVYGD